MRANIALVKKTLQGHPGPERPVPKTEQEKERAGLDCEPGPESRCMNRTARKRA